MALGSLRDTHTSDAVTPFLVYLIDKLFSSSGLSGEEVLYGTSDGKIGLIQLGRQVECKAVFP